MNNFDRITRNSSSLAIAIMGTDVIANIQRRVLKESIEERFDYNESTRRNIEYLQQWLDEEIN